MILTEEYAAAFAQSWVEAFNKHDLALILDHYADDLEFRSPLIPLLGHNSEGIITRKADLAEYFEAGLKAYPDLNFVMQHCFAGVGSLVIYYISVNGKSAAEFFELDDHGKAIKVCCHYMKNAK